MFVLAPEKIELMNERPEDYSCANHYHFMRAWDEAYWGAILHAYDMSKRGFGTSTANRLAWEDFSKEVAISDFGGNC